MAKSELSSGMAPRSQSMSFFGRIPQMRANRDRESGGFLNEKIRFTTSDWREAADNRSLRDSFLVDIHHRFV